MDKTLITQTASAIFDKYPRVVLYTGNEYKTYDYFLSQIRGLVKGVYGGFIAGEFIDAMANLISGQLTQAYQQAFEDQGYTDFILPEYLQTSLTEAIAYQYNFVDQYYRDIVDARIDGTSVEPLLQRAAMWANRWNEGYNEAVKLITAENGGNMIWQYGEAEHCDTCRALNGIVAGAKEWEIAGVKPQNAPNPLIDCGGWQCKCSLTATTRRRSPKALDTILNIITGRSL